MHVVGTFCMWGLIQFLQHSQSAGVLLGLGYTCLHCIYAGGCLSWNWLRWSCEVLNLGQISLMSFGGSRNNMFDSRTNFRT